MLLLAIDPGKDAGWSVWGIESGSLLGCHLGAPRFDSMGQSIILLTEFPELYEDDDPRKAASLMKLSFDAGRRVQDVLGRFDVRQAYAVLPKTWKGSLSKEIHHALAQKTLAADDLRTARTFIETSVLGKPVTPSKQHNVWDAVFLGQWGLGRFRLGVLKTATDQVIQTGLG